MDIITLFCEIDDFFLLHLVINDQGELLSAMVTAGNANDRIPVPQLCQGLIGKGVNICGLR